MRNPDRASRGLRCSLFIAIGAIAYVAAWFLPAWWGAENVDTGHRNWLPGWTAFWLSWEMLISGEQHWSQRLLYATCLTNAVMVVALLLLRVRRARFGLGVALLVCAGANAVWLRGLFADQAPIGIGCVVWVASFALVGIGLVTSRAG